MQKCLSIIDRTRRVKIAFSDIYELLCKGADEDIWLCDKVSGCLILWCLGVRHDWIVRLLPLWLHLTIFGRKMQRRQIFFFLWNYIYEFLVDYIHPSRSISQVLRCIYWIDLEEGKIFGSAATKTNRRIFGILFFRCHLHLLFGWAVCNQKKSNQRTWTLKTL